MKPEEIITAPAQISDALVERIRRRINQETARLARAEQERNSRKMRKDKKEL